MHLKYLLFFYNYLISDTLYLQCPPQILNMGAWARGSERVPVSLPRELEDFVPEVNTDQNYRFEETVSNSTIKMKKALERIYH